MNAFKIYIGIILFSLNFYGCVGPSETTQSEIENSDSITSEDVPLSGDNSKNALDWDGTYIGTLPCADCQGIQTQITLNRDRNFRIKAKYSGKSDSIIESSGVFTWNESGNIVTLNDPTSGTPQQYLVGEGTLTKLDLNGKKITGSTAENYVLSKNAFLLLDKYWKLTELNGKPISFDSTSKNEPHILLKEGNRLTGFAGCNNISGTFVLTGQNKITITGMAVTKMACPDMDFESQFLSALQAADSYSLLDEILILNRARTAPLAKFKTAFSK